MLGEECMVIEEIRSLKMKKKQFTMMMKKLKKKLKKKVKMQKYKLT